MTHLTDQQVREQFELAKQWQPSPSPEMGEINLALAVVNERICALASDLQEARAECARLRAENAKMASFREQDICDLNAAERECWRLRGLIREHIEAAESEGWYCYRGTDEPRTGFTKLRTALSTGDATKEES